MDPNTTTIRWAEEKLKKQGTPPIGSRRRRAAVRTTGSIPFEHLPYQCFQEARTVLQADRQLKLAAIQEKLEKIRRLEAMDPGTLPGGKVQKHHKLRGLRQELEKLKILADINDPLVKRRFEDGQGKRAASQQRRAGCSSLRGRRHDQADLPVPGAA